MKDLFSNHAAQYAEFRPSYTNELVDFISGFSAKRTHALDVATGNGQLAVLLAHRFEKVTATDLSSQQLANAQQLPNISYVTQVAEELDFKDQKFDIITVAQAAHWLDLNAFSERLKLHAHSNTIVAYVGYNLVQLKDSLQESLVDLYSKTLAGCWKPERKLVDNNLKDIYFPFEEILSDKEFTQSLVWSKTEFLGYLNTWSGVKTYEQKFGNNPVELHFDASNLPDEIKVTFPFYYRIGKLA